MSDVLTAPERLKPNDEVDTSNSPADLGTTVQPEKPQISLVQRAKQRAKDSFLLRNVRERLNRAQSESQSAVKPDIPELKKSNNPDIQARVEETRAGILDKYPGAEITTAHQDARDQVARELRHEHLQDENERNKIRAEIAKSEKAFALTTHKQVVDERDEYRKQAQTSEITGLSTQRVYEARLEKALQRLEDGTAQGRVVMVNLDLNGLGAVNDGISHEAGDALLRGVAGALRENQRLDEPVFQLNSSYTVTGESHLHGDEFAAVLENVTDAKVIENGVEKTVSGAKIWADRKIEGFKTTEVTLEDGSVVANGISIAGGYVEVDANELRGLSPEERNAIIKQKKEDADKALYAAKYLSKKRNKALRAEGKPENSVVFLSIDEYNHLDKATLDEIEAYRQEKAAEKKDK